MDGRTGGKITREAHVRQVAQRRPTPITVKVCRQSDLFYSLPLGSPFHGNERSLYCGKVVIAMPHRMILEHELTGEWRIGVE